MEKTENKNLRLFLTDTLLDPVLLYLALTMSSIMYHYRSSLAIVYGVAAYIIGWILFRIFDFVNKHKFLGFISYCVTGIAFLYAVLFFKEKGSEDYPITFFLWFLTPQDALKYNKYFTIAIFLCFMIFMASVIYYFTRVRYRIFMNFLIFIIPFAIYGKEYEKMPTIYIILLAVGYILLMIMFRQLSENDKTVVVDKRNIWKPLAVYTVVFASMAAIVPKPVVKENRTYIETLIRAEALTDRLTTMLNVFRNTTGSDAFRYTGGKNVYYYAKAEEPLKIKTATYSTYDYETDAWSTVDIDSDNLNFNGIPLEISRPADCMKAYLKAAELDNDFAVKYGLDRFVGTEIKDAPTKTVVFYSARNGGNLLPVPESATELIKTDIRQEIYPSPSGTLYLYNQQIVRDDYFVYNYSNFGFMQLGRNKEISDYLQTIDNYAEMNTDAAFILLGSDENKDLRKSLIEEKNYFIGYSETLLDYGDKEDIKTLADEITGEIESDYEKALKLEQYFYNQKYNYDLEYEKAKGENIEDFIFRTKTGVCSEYAGAMIMLARASGIPARYCVGYSMSSPLDEQTYNVQFDANYVVYSKDAHGYPELYIKGYGWMPFDPTITDTLENAVEKDATGTLKKAGVLILTVFLLILLLTLLYPKISHRVFLLICGKKSPSVTTKMVMRRIRKLYGADNSFTTNETAQLAAEVSGADITIISELYDRTVYGGTGLSEDDKKAVLDEYVKAYSALLEAKKKRS